MSHEHHHDHGHGSHGDNMHFQDTPSSTEASVMSHHGAHGAASDSDSSGHHMAMHMYFHGGESETILFEWWKTSSALGLVGSCFAIAFLAFLYEALKFYREHLYRHSFQTVQVNTVSTPVENGDIKETHKTVQVKMRSGMHIWQTCLHVLQVVLSYFLMLVFMTYNVWLCLAVALGAGVGYFCFGWKKSLIVDITEHCH